MLTPKTFSGLSFREIDNDKDVTKDRNPSTFKMYCKRRKSGVRFPDRKAKKSFVCVSLHCWQCDAPSSSNSHAPATICLRQSLPHVAESLHIHDLRLRKVPDPTRYALRLTVSLNLHQCMAPANRDHLSAKAAFLAPRGGHFGQVLLYFLSQRK